MSIPDTCCSLFYTLSPEELNLLQVAGRRSTPRVVRFCEGFIRANELAYFLSSYVFPTGDPWGIQCTVIKLATLVDSLMILPPLPGELRLNASVASTEISPARSPPGRAVHRRCPVATGNDKSHHEPGETCSPHNILEGSKGKEFGRANLFCSGSFPVMLVLLIHSLLHRRMPVTVIYKGLRLS